MHWKKLGQIYCPKAIHPKLMSHAANPLPLLVEGDLYRVFFSGRDADNRSSVGYVDMNLATLEITYVHDKPAFEYGLDSSFFSHGVSIGNCYSAGGKRYILFMGWQCPPDGHWRGDVGRLVLDNDWSLHLDSASPFMASDESDPISLSYPWVIQERDDLYRMWYGSTITWDTGNGEMLHVINSARSTDGERWRREGLAVPYEIGVAQAFSRPTVVGNSVEGYHMWFSYRSGAGEKYRIGYATSADGDSWCLQLDRVGINVSEGGWDSEMIEYPYVFDHKGQRFMLYNGNGHGRTGFGLAVLDRE
ncbi:hypothetical protein [Pseudomonas sp. BN515]|uniref:hypothetical protein n=1 Tax=Pseudomonas sp. BN515 TaxID=2567892 RepID=UPI0024560936|nr:hypothetical protein [Pseudomonas sp. BN515]MDH4872496.1 hypothetical protein [Pseudomonas sp. BN515]